MTAKRETRRIELREKLIMAARALIVQSGLQSLRARDVTAQAGTAIGGLYNAFNDLDDLIIHANARTLASLKQLIAERLQGVEAAGDKLTELALAYLDFARQNHALWAALFEHRLAAGQHMPDWYRTEQAMLIENLIEPLQVLNPELSPDMLVIRARSYFAAVHGIVTISTEQRFIGVPDTDLEIELRSFVDILIKGSEETRNKT